MRRLNAGCGSIQPDGWDNVDGDDRGQEHVCDLSQTLPFPTGTFDYVVANSVLCTIDHHTIPLVMRELRRVMKPGAVLRILVPDIIAGFHAMERGDASFFPVGDHISPWIQVKFSIWLTWYGTNITCFTPLYLESFLREAGFVETTRVERGMTICDDPEIMDLDDRFPECYVMEARCASA